MVTRNSYLRPQDFAREMEIDFTEVGGVRATPSFRPELHVTPTIVYNPVSPICLCVDFNAAPMVWLIVQNIRGAVNVVDEIALEPASVPDMVREFRNRYPAHPAEVWIYGDASGRALSAHDKQSAYDILRHEFRGYPAPLIFYVPSKNPPVRESLDAVELALRGLDGKPYLWIHPNCTFLIQDMLEVLIDNEGKIIKKEKRDNPYYLRTHALDAIRYYLAREMPVADVIASEKSKPRVKINQNYRIPGDL